MSKKKTLSAVIAVALAVGILLSGTFAWQSISQQALNEVYGFVNPGGRLHDDFTIMYTDDTKTELLLTADGTKQYDKNVYVENFTTLAEDGVQVFARVRLDEYMEVGPNAGTDASTATSLISGAELDDKTTWTTYKFGEDSLFRDYWTWNFEGATTYMPTFNKNKDSLEADVNGTFAAAFDDYKKYEIGQVSDPLKAIYDADTAPDGTAEVDELARDGYTVNDVIDGTTTLHENYQQHVTLKEETHTAKETLNGYVISMQQWIDGGSLPGDYWVYDIDGWAYWANPINPDTATGLLLDGIARTTEIINEDWYYGINVVAQFVTSDDLGRDDGTGFYDLTKGEAPSTNALKLLAAIGVDVDTTVDSADALTAALELGGNVTISGTVNGDTVVLPWEGYDDYTSEYMMANGGTLNGGTLMVDGGKVFGLVVEAGNTSEYPTTLNNVTMTGDSQTVLYVGENGGHVTLNSVDVTAEDGSGIYAEFAQGGVTLNNCTVTQSGLGTGRSAWFETAVAAAQGADITINGGEYKSTKYAVYCFEGANPDPSTVTINDGYFEGLLRANNNDKIIIKGGTFTVDPSDYVADGYKAVKNETTGNWEVTTA